MPELPLCRLFHEHSPAEVRLSDVDLEHALRRLIEQGRRAWPALELSPEAFVRWLAPRRVVDRPAGGGPAADLFLASACVERVQGAVEAFEHAHVRRVGALLGRTRRSAAFVDEVQQLVREKLFVGPAPKIGEYDGRTALTSWLRVIALRTAIDLHRRGNRAVDGAGAEPDGGRPPATTADPEADYIKQLYRRDFNEALRCAVAALAGEQREILRLHFVDGLTLDQLAAQLGVHRATVARRIAAAREAVDEEARRLLRARLGVGEAELESLLRVMRSQLELSLSGLLQRDAP